MTKETLRKLVRSTVEERKSDWLADTTDSQLFTIDDYLDMAYIAYAVATCCFKVTYTLGVTADQAVYLFSAFGSGAVGAKPGARDRKSTRLNSSH